MERRCLEPLQALVTQCCQLCVVIASLPVGCVVQLPQLAGHAREACAAPDCCIDEAEDLELHGPLSGDDQRQAAPDSGPDELQHTVTH